MAIAYGNVLGFPFLARMGSPRITGEECLVVGLPSVPVLTSLVALMSLIRREVVLQWMLLAVMVAIMQSMSLAGMPTESAVAKPFARGTGLTTEFTFNFDIKISSLETCCAAWGELAAFRVGADMEGYIHGGRHRDSRKAPLPSQLLLVLYLSNGEARVPFNPPSCFDRVGY